MITYSTGTPTEKGVYACRHRLDAKGFWSDLFLTYDGRSWSYTNSGQTYRGTPPLWLGPLPRAKV